MKKTCAITGCDRTDGIEEHHFLEEHDETIPLCSHHHGLMHGVEWERNLGVMIREGKEKARSGHDEIGVQHGKRGYTHGLIKRGEVYYYQFAVPRPLRYQIGRTMYQGSLRTMPIRF